MAAWRSLLPERTGLWCPMPWDREYRRGVHLEKCGEFAARHGLDADEVCTQILGVLTHDGPVAEDALCDLLGYDELPWVMDLIAHRELRASAGPAWPAAPPAGRTTRSGNLPTTADLPPPPDSRDWPQIYAENHACYERGAAADRRAAACKRLARSERCPRRCPARAQSPRDDAPPAPVTPDELYQAVESGSLAAVAAVAARAQREDRPSAREALASGGVGPDGWTGLMRAALQGSVPLLGSGGASTATWHDFAAVRSALRHPDIALLVGFPAVRQMHDADQATIARLQADGEGALAERTARQEAQQELDEALRRHVLAAEEAAEEASSLRAELADARSKLEAAQPDSESEVVEGALLELHRTEAREQEQRQLLDAALTEVEELRAGLRTCRAANAGLREELATLRVGAADAERELHTAHREVAALRAAMARQALLAEVREAALRKAAARAEAPTVQRDVLSGPSVRAQLLAEVVTAAQRKADQRVQAAAKPTRDALLAEIRVTAQQKARKRRRVMLVDTPTVIPDAPILSPAPARVEVFIGDSPSGSDLTEGSLISEEPDWFLLDGDTLDANWA